MPASGLGPRDVHIDRPLTNFSKMFARPELVSQLILPSINVKNMSNLYYVMGREELKADDNADIVAPGAAAADFTWRPEGTQTYNAQKRGIKMFLADLTVRNEDSPIRARMRTNDKINYNIRMYMEKRVKDLVNNHVTSAIPATAALGTKWDKAAADVEADIKAAIEFVRLAVGKRPNTILMSRAVADATVDNFKASAEISLGQKSGIWQMPKTIFGLDVIVAEATEDTANKGATAVLADLFIDNVTVFYKDPNPGLDSPGLGLMPRVRNFLTRTWRDEEREGSWLEVSVVQDEILASPTAGRIIRDVLT